MTLVETLVVSAILMLVVGLGLPVMRANGAAADWEEARAAMDNSVRAARAEALRRDEVIIFQVAGDGASFGLSNGAPSRTPGAVRLRASGPIGFYPDGSSSGGSVLMTDGARSAEWRFDRSMGLGAPGAAHG